MEMGTEHKGLVIDFSFSTYVLSRWSGSYFNHLTILPSAQTPWKQEKSLYLILLYF